VRAAAWREGGEVVVAVDDQGPGVPVEMLPHLFEKFARGGERTAGTGLGLYFCRITVEGWGGGIGYEPRAEGGARFWIRLPLAEGRDHG
jgi:signal transduction histidine kinase